MFNNIKQVYPFFLRSSWLYKNIRNTQGFLIYFFIGLFLFCPQKKINAGKRATHTMRKKRNKQATCSDTRKNKRPSYLNPKRRIKVKKELTEDNKVAAQEKSSSSINPSGSQYVQHVIDNEYKIALQNASTPEESQIAYILTVLHAAFEDVWRPSVEKSFSEFIPLLSDKTTRHALNVFLGPKERESETLIKKTAETLHAGANGMVQYMIFLDYLSVNADKSRIRYRENQLRTLKNESEATYQLYDLFGEYYVPFFYAATHLASDKHPLRFKEYMDRFQGDSMKKLTNSDILAYLEKQMGSPASNAAKKNSYASLFFRFLLIELGWVESLTRLKKLFEEIGKWITIFFRNPRESFDYMGRYRAMDLASYDPKRHPTPLGHSYLFRGLNVLFLGYFKPFAAFLAWPFHFILTILQEFAPGNVFLWLDMFWYFVKNIYRHCQQLLIVTNGLINLLHGMRDTLTLIKKVKKILETHPSLQRVFVMEYAKIRRLTNLKKTKKFRLLLAEVEKVRKTRVTMGFVLKPWHTLPSQLMALYTKILGEPEEVHEIFRKAQFAALKILYAAFKARKVLLSHEKAPYPICIPDIGNNQESTQRPSMIFEDIYTPMLYNKKKPIVKNNISLGGQHKNGFITGPNGSGKSVYIKGISTNVIATLGMGISFASKATIHVMPHLIIFDANASDDIIAGKSLFQEEAGRYETLLTTIKKYNFPMLIIFDEKLGSTIPKEAMALLTSMLITLDQEKGTTLLVSSHFREIYHLFKKMKLSQFKFMSTEYQKGKGLTFKIKDGTSEDPSSVYTLMDLNFHKKTFNRFISILNQDSTYSFKHKLPGYKKIKHGKASKLLRVLFYFLLVLLLLGLAFFFVRRYQIQITMKVQKRSDKQKQRKEDYI
ncbi:MAG: hypothetical protein AAF770_02800 [Bacteroidota bacterium]